MMMIIGFALVAFVCVMAIMMTAPTTPPVSVAAVREIREPREWIPAPVQVTEKAPSMLPCTLQGNKARFQTRAGGELSAKVVDKVGKIVYLQRRGHRHGQIFTRQLVA